MATIFPNLFKTINFQAQNAQQIPAEKVQRIPQQNTLYSQFE